jgi:hypothetical protein
MIGSPQPIYGWWGPDALRHINKSRGLQAHDTRFVVRRQTLLTTLGRRSTSAQWRREAPLRPPTSSPSSVSAGGDPKDDGIYSVTTSTPTPWTLPEQRLLLDTMV